jgi:hypothetical protein
VSKQTGLIPPCFGVVALKEISQAHVVVVVGPIRGVEESGANVIKTTKRLIY